MAIDFTKITEEELKTLGNHLGIAINLKKARRLQILDEIFKVEEKALTHTTASDEIFIGYKYVKVPKPEGYVLQANEQWGENIHFSDVKIAASGSPGKFIDGRLVVLVPDKIFIRKKTKERLGKFEEEIWKKVEEMVKKVVPDTDI